MRHLLIWMFTRRETDDRWTVSAKIASQLTVLMFPLLAAAALWRWSNGMAMAVMMTCLGLVGYVFTTWYRLNILPPRPVDEARRARRRARTEFWRREIESAVHEPGKRGDLARSIIKGWQEAAAPKDDKPRST